MAVAKPGTRRPIAIRVNSKVFAGKSLRSTSQAIGSPNPSATASETNAKPNVSETMK
jgi:hypothetical protein